MRIIKGEISLLIVEIIKISTECHNKDLDHLKSGGRDHSEGRKETIHSKDAIRMLERNLNAIHC